jgi:hypothetical protein
MVDPEFATNNKNMNSTNNNSSNKKKNKKTNMNSRGVGVVCFSLEQGWRDGPG